jgi:TM2 domain-containing membrane protein YozV
MTTQPTPAGWYPDPTGKSGQMYWDGQQWHQAQTSTTSSGLAPLPGTENVIEGPLSDKVKIIAAVLSFIFGWWGAGRWYLGDKKIAAVQLGLGLTGLILSVFLIGVPLLLAAWAWGVVDAIMILTDKVTDAQGHKLR